MATLDWFRKMFDYNHWANQKALDSIETISGPHERALTVAGHILGAQRVWLARLEDPGSAPGAPWPDLTLEEARAAAEELHIRYAVYLDVLAPQTLAEDLIYRNTKGVEFRTLLGDVLTHLVMHSAYHRGQIAAAVREAGGTPASTDYVAYVRQFPKSQGRALTLRGQSCKHPHIYRGNCSEV